MTAPQGQNQQTNQRRTIEQQRGEQAWKDVKEAKEQLRDKQKEYRSQARGLNAMIQINGLGQTLAFLQAKGTKNPAHKLLFKHLSAWVGEALKLEGQPNLLDWVLKAQRDHYRRAMVECLAFGVWLRRFAEAELEEGPTERGEG